MPSMSAMSSMTEIDQGMNPRTGQAVGAPVAHTSLAEVDRSARAAAMAAPALAGLSLGRRADLLRAVAGALEDARAELVALADAETGLGTGRLDGELTRTTVQLEMFAEVVADGSVVDAIIDYADPAAKPPRPDLRRMLVPLGPTAVFAASNFPFAFSVAGGDTASALAAGCPVLVKAHPGHPGLSAAVADIVVKALTRAGAPDGTFAVVHGFDAGRALLTHPAVAAAAFTGSIAGGRALLDLANARPEPIPFYGELGSLNPTVVTPAAVASRGADIAAGFVASYTLGSGQFCTKPGLLFLPAEHGLTEALVAQTTAVELGPLLNRRIQDGFSVMADELARTAGVRRLTLPSIVESPGYGVSSVLLAVSAGDLIRATTLLEECFGPAALVVEYGSVEELVAALDVLPGSLTASLHADQETEPELAGALLARLSARAGRVVWNGWPTGVAVTWAQHHGGPWPATTAPLHTSVGVTAIRRFQRPLVWQNVPEPLLPEALREANPLDLPRRVNGRIHNGHAASPVGC
jgi:NADP-dependent aldehyde dehydrogenase